MRNRHPVWFGLLLLLVVGAVGFGIGWGIELLISGSANWNGPVAGAFAILFSVPAFFFGVYGYRGITRGLVWQVLGTFLGALFVTGIRALLGAEKGQDAVSGSDRRRCRSAPLAGWGCRR